MALCGAVISVSADLVVAVIGYTKERYESSCKMGNDTNHCISPPIDDYPDMLSVGRKGAASNTLTRTVS